MRNGKLFQSSTIKQFIDGIVKDEDVFELIDDLIPQTPMEDDLLVFQFINDENVEPLLFDVYLKSYFERILEYRESQINP